MKKIHLRQIQHLQKELDAIQTIKNYNLHRYRVLQQQRNKDYRNEYDRLIGELSKTNLRPTVKHELRKRAQALNKCMKTMKTLKIYFLSNNIYRDDWYYGCESCRVKKASNI